MMPMDRSRYAEDWEGISQRIRFDRAGGRCEWVEEDGARCGAIHRAAHPVTGSRVILTTAHLDHDVTNNDEANLLALCQLHHLRYDADHHAANAVATRRRRQVEAGQLTLDIHQKAGD
jgi:hypothetical protein